MSTLREKAHSVKKAGRKGDKHLIHITEEELFALLSKGRLTRNPKTGLPEAWSLSHAFQPISNVAQDIGHGVQSAGTGIEDWAGNMGTDFFKGADTAQSPSGELTGPLAPGAAAAGVSNMIGISDARRDYEHDTGPLGSIYEGFIFGGSAIPSSSGGDASIFSSTGDEALIGNAGGTQMPPAQVPYGDPTNPPMMPPAVAETPNQAGSVVTPSGPQQGNNLFADPNAAPPDSTFGPSTFNPEFNLGSNFSGQTGNAFSPDTPFGSSVGTGASDVGSGAGVGEDSSFWDQLKNMFGKGGGVKGAGSALSAGSGLYGLYLANQSRKAANNAAGDPHRNQYQDQLAALMADPNSVTSMPGYQFGMDQGRQAIQRQGAANGSGGKEAIALAQFSPAYAQAAYQSQVTNLMNAARSGQPNGVQLSGLNSSNELVSRALASMGYALQTAG